MKIKFLLFILLFLGCTGCTGNSDALKLSTCNLNLGNVNLNDSVTFSFTIKNRGTNTINACIMPDCDCIIVNAEQIELLPRKKCRVDGKLLLDDIGDYIGYVYVMVGEKFYTIKLTCNVK